MTRQGRRPRQPRSKPQWDLPPGMLAHEIQPQERVERVLLLVDGDNANQSVLEVTEGVINWGMFRDYIHLACNSYQEGAEPYRSLTPVGSVTDAHMFRTVVRYKRETPLQFRDAMIKIDQRLKSQGFVSHLYDRYPHEPGYADSEMIGCAWDRRDDYDTFIIVSNDSDFLELMKELRRYGGGRRVIHVGIRGRSLSERVRGSRMPYVDLNTMMNHYSAIVAPRPKRLVDQIARSKQRNSGG